MKKFAILFALLLIANVGFAQSGSTITKGAPLNTNSGAITGFQALATPTLTLNNTATKIGALPAGTVAVWIVASGAINFGDSTVKTSTDGKFPTIADAGQLRIPIYPNTSAPNIYLINNATGSASVARIIAEVQK